MWPPSLGMGIAKYATPSFLAVGDSKTHGVAGKYGIIGYEGYLEKETGWHEILPRLGHDGFTLADLVRAYSEDVARVQARPDVILLDIGTNDVKPNLGSAAIWHWRYDLLTYVRAWHARFPAARIGVAYPRNYAGYTDADFAWMDAAIDAVIASEPYTFAGPHEAMWLRQNSVDGAHPTPDGYRIEASEWAALLNSLVM